MKKANKSHKKKASAIDGQSLDVLRIDHDLSIRNAFDHKNQIDVFMRKGKDFTISIQDLESIDLAGLQLLISAKKTAESNKLSCHIEGESTEELRLLLGKTGLDVF